MRFESYQWFNTFRNPSDMKDPNGGRVRRVHHCHDDGANTWGETVGLKMKNEQALSWLLPQYLHKLLIPTTVPTEIKSAQAIKWVNEIKVRVIYKDIYEYSMVQFLQASSNLDRSYIDFGDCSTCMVEFAIKTLPFLLSNSVLPKLWKE